MPLSPWQDRKEEIRRIIREETAGNSSHSKRTLLLLVLVIIVVIALVLVYFAATAEQIVQNTPNAQNYATNTQNAGNKAADLLPINCKYFGCLTEAADTCSKATLTNASTINIFDVLVTSTIYYEINKTGEECQLYIRIENQSFAFSDQLKQQMLSEGKTQEQMQQEEQDANTNKYMIGKSGTCKFNDTNNLLTFLGQLINGNFSIDINCVFEDNQLNCINNNLYGAQCSGCLFSNSDCTI
jgi:hypothetical protein